MSTSNDIHSDQNYFGTQRFNGPVILAPSSVNGTAINPATPVPVAAVTTKRHAQVVRDGALSAGTNTYLLDLESVAGTLSEFRAILDTVPTSSDTVSVDLEKWNGSAWASVLSAAISFSSSDTAKTMKTGTISLSSVSSGNLFRVKVIVAGTSAQGLVAKAGFEATG